MKSPAFTQPRSFAARKAPENEVAFHTSAFLVENAYFFCVFFFCRTSTLKRFENGGFRKYFLKWGRLKMEVCR